MKKQYFLLVLIILGLFSCKKDETPYYQIPGEMKEYFEAHEGSYWIYLDNFTGLSDSTYVNGFQDFDDETTYPGKKIEVIEMNFKSQFLSGFRMNYSEKSFTGNRLEIKSRLIAGDGSDAGSIAYVYNWPPNTSRSIDTTQHFTYNVIARDSVNNIHYYNVIYTKLEKPMNLKMGPSYYTREIWVAPGTGIIRYYEHFGEAVFSYSLLRKKV
ncbi:MAG: hypothetical protein ACM3N9_04375, partial [Syntrophothermus sp.]